jgi:hypothetical protein
MPRTRYGRYWDLHLTAADGGYDFARHIRTMAAFQGRERSFGLGNQLPKQKIYIEGDEFDDILTSLPVTGLPSAEGYVATAVTVKSINRNELNTDAREVIRWINDANFRSKIRVNVHGSRGGTLSMGPEQGEEGFDPENEMPASKLVVWLKANGLKSGGLKTIAVCACYAGLDDNLIPNSLSNGKDKTSAIAQIAAALGSSKGIGEVAIPGVEVTGVNESVTGNGFSRSLVVPTGGSWTPIRPVLAGSIQKGTVTHQAFTFQLEAGPDWAVRPRTPFNRSFVSAPAGAVPERLPGNKDDGPNSGWKIAGVTIPRKSNWLVFVEPDPAQPQTTRVNVRLAPGWRPDLLRPVAGALITSRYIRRPGGKFKPGKAVIRIAQSTGKERVFS